MADVAAAGLAARFFEWLSIAHPHNNVHNIRLCRLVADARVLPPAALAQLQAVDRVRCLPGCPGHGVRRGQPACMFVQED